MLLTPWHHDNDERYRADFHGDYAGMRGQLHFSGPFEWEVTVEPGKVELDLLPFRHLRWVGPVIDEWAISYRTAYCKAIATLVRSLGGTEVTDLADNTHRLSAFWEISDYVAMRRDLREQLGPPLTSPALMAAWQESLFDKVTRRYKEDCAYLVDNFSDLD